MKRLAIACLTTVLVAAPASAKPSYKLDKAQSRVLSLSGLATDPDGCHPFTMTGRVTDQSFAGPRVSGFTLADKEGSRTFINVEVLDLTTAGSRVALAWIEDGLQKMLRKGQRVSIRAYACGAAGRVMMLDAVRLQ